MGWQLFRAVVIVAIVGLHFVGADRGENVTEYTLYETLPGPHGAALVVAKMQTEFLNAVSSFLTGLAGQFSQRADLESVQDPRLLRII
jgi:hypothetical protein